MSWSAQSLSFCQSRACEPIPRPLISSPPQVRRSDPSIDLHTLWPLGRCEDGTRCPSVTLDHGQSKPTSGSSLSSSSVSLRHPVSARQGIIAWPVAKLLEIVLGPHHGIIYRRTGEGATTHPSICRCTNLSSFSELKELIAMHSSTGQHGGDLNNDTVTIIGATLDLQEKVVRQVSITFVPRPISYLLIAAHPGYDTDPRRFYAVNQQQIGL